MNIGSGSNNTQQRQPQISQVLNTTSIHFIRLNRGTKENLRQSLKYCKSSFPRDYNHGKCTFQMFVLQQCSSNLTYLIQVIEIDIACGSRCFTSASRSASTCSHEPPWPPDRTCKPAACANCRTSCQSTLATSPCSQSLPLSSASTRRCSNLAACPSAPEAISCHQTCAAT